MPDCKAPATHTWQPTILDWLAMKDKVDALMGANARLANIAAGAGRVLEEGKRDLMAHGWDAAAEYAVKSLDGDAGDLGDDWLKDENPWRSTT